jgi:hypothetical protein
MDLEFSILFVEGLPYWFSSVAPQREHKVLCIFFTSLIEDGLDKYYDVLNVIDDVNTRKTEEPELFSLIDVAGAFYYFYKDQSYFSYEKKDGGPGSWIMSTSEFRELLLRWMRFVETNIEMSSLKLVMRDFWSSIVFKDNLPESFRFKLPIGDNNKILELFFSSSRDEGVTVFYELLDEINNIQSLNQHKVGWIDKVFHNVKKSIKGTKKRQDVTLFIEKQMSYFKYGKNDKIAEDLDMSTAELKEILILWIRFVEVNMTAFCCTTSSTV